MSDETEFKDQSEESYEKPEGEEESFEGDYVGEEKKSVNQNTLVIGAILAVVVGLTYFMMLKSGPQTASAMDAQAVDPAGQTISDFLGGSGNNIHLMETMLQKTASVVSRFKTYSDTKQIPLASLATNPFHFARVETRKVDLDDQAAHRAREEQIQETIAAASQLHLQSVLIGGARKSCIVDGRAYLEGQQIADRFQILEIKTHSVIVADNGLKLEISLAPAPSAGN
jgi:hypothetical protein